jgi:hypothetical protein
MGIGRILYAVLVRGLGRPSGTFITYPLYPALKRWAKVDAPLRGSIREREFPGFS